MECLCNRIKHTRKKLRDDPLKVSTPKKTRQATVKNDLLKHYSTRLNEGTSSEDPASIAEHLKDIASEMAKEKPRDSIVPHSLSSRRSCIQHDTEDVSNILEVYPALCRPSVVSEFYIIGYVDVSG